MKLTWHDRQNRDDAKVAKKIEIVITKLGGLIEMLELGIADRPIVNEMIIRLSAMSVKYKEGRS